MAKSVTIGGMAFWSSVSSPGELYNDGDVMYVVLDDSATMDLVRRTTKEMFTTTVTNAAARGYLVIVNGLMYSVGVSAWTYRMGWDPVDPKDVTPNGQLVDSTRVVAGRSAPSMFYIAQGLGPVSAYDFDAGDPTAVASNPLAAMGGLGPLIIGGLNYGNGNLYVPGMTAGPATRDPGPAAGNLTQRNNSTYVAMAGRGASCGKTVVARCKAQKKLLVLGQRDGASTGITLDNLRDKLAGVGVEDAVFFDGSDSVTFYAKGSLQISPGKNKDRTIPAGLGFRA